MVNLNLIVVVKSNVLPVEKLHRQRIREKNNRNRNIGSGMEMGIFIIMV